MIDETHYIIKSYDIIAYEFSNTRIHIWDFVKKFLEDKDTSYGLDVGCGNGKNMIFKNMIGVDNSIKFLDICREKNKEVILSDMCLLPFKNNEFDYTISIASFHHLSSEERRKECMNEMIRVLRYGGEGIISIWSYEYQNKHNFDLGDNFVPWVSRNPSIIPILRYYYIMDLNMLKSFLDQFSDLINIITIKNEKGNWIIHFQKKDYKYII